MSSTLKQAILSLKSRIADAYTAIAAKGGTMPATQDTANLPTAIASIPTGGGEEPEEKDVLFIDYDGTILYSYTYAELEELTELPSPPQHDGLTFVQWTNTLQELKTYKKKITLSGAMYRTTDTYIHIFIETYEDDMTFTFSSYFNGEDVDWGDGTIETNVGTTKSHTYANKGRYEIIDKLAYNSKILVSDYRSKPLIYGFWCGYSDRYPNESTIAQQGFNDCINLKFLLTNISHITFGGNDGCANCRNLGSLVSVGGLVGGKYRTLQYTGIKYLTGYITEEDNWCSEVYYLRRINFTNGSNYYNRFPYFYNLQYIFLNPDRSVDTMTNCLSAREIHIPHTSVPSLANTNYFQNIPTTCKIYVKTGLLSQYETATNWSTIYSQYQFIEED